MLDIFESPIFRYYETFKDDCLAFFTSIAPPPQRDFFHLQITKDKIFWRCWVITSRNEAEKYTPKEVSCKYAEFQLDTSTQGEIRRVMGSKILRYCLNITKGRIDFLPRMPPSIIKKILNYVNVEDIVSFGRSCKAISEICNDDDVWKRVYIRYHKEPPSDIVKELARIYTWRRVFFTSKLKLQMQIRRLRLENSQPAGDEEINEVISSVSREKTMESDLLPSQGSKDSKTTRLSTLYSVE